MQWFDRVWLARGSGSQARLQGGVLQGGIATGPVSRDGANASGSATKIMLCERCLTETLQTWLVLAFVWTGGMSYAGICCQRTQA
jgi:hypothetical protein